MKKVELKYRLKEAMELREFKQADLAEKYGFDKGQLSSWLSGKYKPRQNNIAKLAMALSVDEAWLMGYDVPMDSSLAPKESSDDKSHKTLFNFINSHPDSIGYLAILCKNERIEKEYTEKTVAQKCNITLKEYLDFENAYKNIGNTKISSILLFFNFNITFILGYLVGATGSRDEIVDIMVSQASEKDKDNMKYIASQMVKMDTEELSYFAELLKRDLPENKTNTQKFTKAIYDFHKTQHKDEA